MRALPAAARPGRRAALGSLALLLATLALIALITALDLGRLLHAPRDADARRRVTAVALTDVTQARFALPGGDTQLRLVTNGLPPAVLPVGADLVYGLRVTLVRPNGSPVLDQTLGFRSRESRVAGARGWESSAFDPGGARIADSRRVDLPLPGPQPPGTVVTLSAIEGAPLLARAWTRVARAASMRQVRMLGERDAAFASALLGLPGWDHLGWADRAALVEHRYARLAALGRPGSDHALRTFSTRPVDAVQQGAEIPDVSAARGLSVPLQGPASARVTLRWAGGADAAPVHATLTQVAAETTALGTWTLDADAPVSVWEGALPASLAALEIRADGPLFAAVEAPGTAAVPAREGAALERILPTELRLEATPAAPGAPAVFDAEGVDADPLTRLLDVEIWGAPGTRHVQLRLLDASGATRALEQEIALVASGLDVVEDGEGEARPVAGPARLRVLLPRAAVRLEVLPEDLAWVRFQVPLHTELDDTAPDALDDAPLRLRHAPAAGERRRWSTVSALSPSARVTIRSFTQVAPRPETPPPAPDAATRALSPVSGAMRLSALEPVRPGERAHVLTEVPADRPLHVEAGRGAARARLTYELDDLGALGQSAQVSLDGRAAGGFKAAMSRGTMKLPALSPGRHALSVSAPPGLRVYVNLPPAAGDPAQAVRQRTVWRLSPSGVTVLVPASARALNVVVYDPAARARPELTLEAVLDGGAPRRRAWDLYTRLSPSRVIRALPAASGAGEARLVDGARPSIGLARTLVIPLGDDLSPGEHRLSLRPSREVVARFFTYLTESE